MEEGDSAPSGLISQDGTASPKRKGRGRWPLLAVCLIVLGILLCRTPSFRQKVVVFSGHFGRWSIPLARWAIHHDPDGMVQFAGSQTLQTLGKDALPTLLNCLKDDDAQVRAEAAQDIGLLSAADAADSVAPLTELLSDSDARVRTEVVATLGKVAGDSEAAIDGIIQATTDSDATVRWKAVEGIGRTRLKASLAVPLLTKLLHDENESVRSSAVEALSAYGAEAHDAIPEIEAMQADPSAEVRGEAMEALGRLRPGNP